MTLRIRRRRRTSRFRRWHAATTSPDVPTAVPATGSQPCSVLYPFVICPAAQNTVSLQWVSASADAAGLLQSEGGALRQPAPTCPPPSLLPVSAVFSHDIPSAVSASDYRYHPPRHPDLRRLGFPAACILVRPKKVDDHIGVAIAGLTADERVLSRSMRNKCINYSHTTTRHSPSAAWLFSLRTRLRVGNMDRAEEMLREISVQRGLSPDVVTYTSVISGYCKVGKMENAVALLDDMFKNGVRPNLITFNVIIDGFGKNGEVASAMKMCERMAVNGLYPDVVTYTSLIDGYCRCGELEQGIKLWDEMHERKVCINVFTFSILISSLCKENRLNEACNLLKQLSWRKDIVPQPFVYNPVIDGLCKAGNVDEANAIIAEMEAKGCVHDKMTFTILILGHCMKGKMCDAIKIYRKMLSVGCAPDKITINSLISCLRKAGMAWEANEIEQKASNGLQPNSSPSQRGTPYNINVTMAV